MAAAKAAQEAKEKAKLEAEEKKKAADAEVAALQKQYEDWLKASG